MINGPRRFILLPTFGAHLNQPGLGVLKLTLRMVHLRAPQCSQPPIRSELEIDRKHKEEAVSLCKNLKQRQRINRAPFIIEKTLFPRVAFTVLSSATSVYFEASLRYNHYSYSDLLNQDPLSLNHENAALRN